jgi:hypothetical protein
MEYLGLLVEVLFLLLGIQVYRFATGRIRPRKPEAQARSEQFRQENKGWMRILSLALIAIMAIEISLHIVQMVR